MILNKEKINLLDSTIQKLANPQKKQQIQKFFKITEGHYAEKDRFLGIYVPDLKKIASQYQDLSFSELDYLLSSEFNEKRLLALIILTRKYARSDQENQHSIYDFYLQHLKFINNWNLVDASAPYILGPYLLDQDKKILFEFIKSESVWERRIAILSTFHFIKMNHFDTSLKMAKLLLKDPHDLIHKAVGWMLRTIGKKDLLLLQQFLNQYSHEMPRVMLRYAIEKFSPEEKIPYLKNKK